MFNYLPVVPEMELLFTSVTTVHSLYVITDVMIDETDGLQSVCQ